MNQAVKYILIVAAIIAFAACIWLLKNVFIYITIAGILALIGEPLAGFFERIKIKKKSISRATSSALTLLSMIFILLAFIALFIPLIVQEARIVSSIKTQDVMSSFQEPLHNIELMMNKYQVNYGNNSIREYMQTKLTSLLDFAQLSNVVNAIISITGDVFIAIFAILFLAFFFIKDKQAIHQYLLLLSPPKHIKAFRKILSHTKRLLTRYFIGIVIDAILVGTLISIGLSIIGVENAMIIGLLAGIVNVIPYVGPLIGTGFATIIAISTNLNVDFYSAILPLVLKIAVIFTIVTGIDSFLFQPMIYSNTVKAHPLEIFLVILIAGTLTGIGGMIIAIPVYTILRVIAKEFLHNFQIVRNLTKDLDEE